MALETEERAVEQESSRLAVPLCEKYKLATGAYDKAEMTTTVNCNELRVYSQLQSAFLIHKEACLRSNRPNRHRYRLLPPALLAGNRANVIIPAARLTAAPWKQRRKRAENSLLLTRREPEHRRRQRIYLHPRR